MGDQGARLAAIPVREVRLRATPKGRQVDSDALDEVTRLLGDAPLRRDLLIEHLHRIQDRYGRLSDSHLTALARLMKLSLAEVFEVATFYHHFDVVREGDAVPASLTVRVCSSLSCEMAGANDLRERLTQTLGTEVRVLAAPCVGRCEAAPVAVVHQNPILHASAEAVMAAVRADARTHPLAVAAAVASGQSARSPRDYTPSTEAAPVYQGYAGYRAAGGYRLAAACRRGERKREDIFSLLEQSGLRGLGGAGFPTGRKWRIVAAEPAPRLMAVNIDEGEPGTFKDRHYLERDPHRFIEGLLIAAWAVDVAEVYVYLRDEYHGVRALLEQELARLHADPPCALPVIHLRRGAGAYICGEESAMIESIEGKRGMPRLRPPYVAQVGLFGRPTLEHNMETLWWVRDLIERGPAWFTEAGRHGRHGLRSFSLSGRVQRPGVHVAPAGITVRELIDEYGGGMLPGHTFYAYLPGGASGGILPASMGDIPLDFDTLNAHGAFIGSAAVMVLSQTDRAIDAARNMLRFFAEESCGQCTPCRVGTAKAVTLMAKPQWDAGLLTELASVMADASICGLGQAAPNPFLGVLKHFPHELSGV